MAVFIFLYESHQDGCRCVKLFAVYSLKTKLAEQKLYICIAVLVGSLHRENPAEMCVSKGKVQSVVLRPTSRL